MIRTLSILHHFLYRHSYMAVFQWLPYVYLSILILVFIIYVYLLVMCSKYSRYFYTEDILFCSVATTLLKATSKQAKHTGSTAPSGERERLEKQVSHPRRVGLQQ